MTQLPTNHISPKNRPRCLPPTHASRMYCRCNPFTAHHIHSYDHTNIAFFPLTFYWCNWLKKGSCNETTAQVSAPYQVLETITDLSVNSTNIIYKSGYLNHQMRLHCFQWNCEAGVSRCFPYLTCCYHVVTVVLHATYLCVYD